MNRRAFYVSLGLSIAISAVYVIVQLFMLTAQTPLAGLTTLTPLVQIGSTALLIFLLVISGFFFILHIPRKKET
jgi:hypothetical protein